MSGRKDIKLLDLCKVLDTDYIDYGGKISRWADPDGNYHDCSCGCKYFIPLFDTLIFSTSSGNESKYSSILNLLIFYNKFKIFISIFFKKK